MRVIYNIRIYRYIYLTYCLSVKGFLDERPLFARHLSALGSCGCIWMLQLSNLIGYSYGHTFFRRSFPIICLHVYQYKQSS